MQDMEKLIRLAKKAHQNAYAPYSKFKVGAVLLTKAGNIYSGCNVENASYGLSICAERVAMSNAITNGEKEFENLVVYTDRKEFFLPCGACRQFISEFSDELKIIIVNGMDKIKITNIKELLPEKFKLS